MIYPNSFGTMSHKVYSFSVMVSSDTTEEQLADNKFWSNYASKMNTGSEIRAIADDGSFVCRLIVLYASGTDVNIKIESFTDFGKVDLQLDEDYQVKNGGGAGWYVKKISTGERVKTLTGLPSEAEAYKQLAEYKQMLAA